ncbi:MAG: CPBP family intramembrane metalloprotease [Deltaproteobacteria bacterium]|nr:CPBP family intramembrane metalloprotease [Deltaproteobacteria bacterium]
MRTSALALRSDHFTSRSIGWLALLPALVVPLFGSLIYFVWVPEGALGQAAYTLTKVFTLVYPLFFLGSIGVNGLTRRRDDQQAKWPSRRAVLLTGLGSGVLIAGLGVVLMLTPLGDLVRQGAGAATDKAEALGFRQHFVLFAIFISVIHSGLEEYYWRFFVYGQLREKCRPWVAHGIAAVAFAAHHLVLTLQFFSVGLAVFMAVAVAVGGLLWTVMYERQGTVLGGWLSHLCVDAFLMLVAYQLVMG